MAMCKNCPALEADPAGVGVIEYYSCGDGCPDQDYDAYGGDCYNTHHTDLEQLVDDMAEAQQYERDSQFVDY